MSDTYQERPDTCPLCGEEKTGLEFHHWDYDDDTGCYLCEPCHIAVHGGTEWWNATDRRRRSQTWKVDAVENLVRQHVEAHPDETTVREIVERYNIPDDEARELSVLVELALDELRNDCSVGTDTERGRSE